MKNRVEVVGAFLFLVAFTLYLWALWVFFRHAITLVKGVGT